MASATTTTETPPTDHHYDDKGQIVRSDVQRRLLADLEETIKAGTPPFREMPPSPVAAHEAKLAEQRHAEDLEHERAEQERLAAATTAPDDA